MRVVLDCNVIVSAAWNEGPARRMVRYAVTHATILISPTMLAEYERVCDYPKLSAKRPVLAGMIAELKRVGTPVDDAPPSIELPDPKDVAYVTTALEGEADVLVTGNLKHFPDRLYGTTRILSVREFAELAGLAHSPA